MNRSISPKLIRCLKGRLRATLQAILDIYSTKSIVLLVLFSLTASCGIFDGNISDKPDNSDDSNQPCINTFLEQQKIDGFYNLTIGRSCYEGLASVSINNIAVDSTGTTYLATAGGLTIMSNREGHSEYKNVTMAQGIPSSVIRDIAIDRNDHILLATYGGLAVSTDRGESFVTKSTGLPLWYGLPITNGVAVDSEGRIFVATGSGVSISTDGGESFTTKTTANGLGNNYITGIATDHLDHIYAYSSGGLSISTDHGSSFVNRTTANGLYSNSVSGIYVDKSGNIYVSMYNYGVGQAVGISTDGGTTFISTMIAGAPGKYTLRAINMDSKGSIFVGTERGVAVSTNGGSSYTIMGDDHGFDADAMISVIYIDSNDEILASDLNRGLYRSKDSGNSFTSDKSSKEAGGKYYYQPLVTNDKVYVPSASGVYIFDKKSLEITRLTKSDGLISDQAMGIVKGGDGTLYILTDIGISITHDQGKTFLNKGVADGAPVGAYSIAVDSNNNLFAAGYGIGGLMISTDGGATWTKKTTSDGLPSNSTTGVYVDHNNTVYVSTSAGLAKTTNLGSSFTNKNTGNGLGHAYIYKVTVEPLTGTILVGTNNGLSISTDGGNSFVTKRAANGLGGRFVQQAIMSSDGMIYAMTDGGLSVSQDGGTSFSVTPVKTYAGSIVLYENSELYVADSGYVYFKKL